MITLLTWNIRSFGQEERAERILQAIEAKAPDIVSLQEVYTPLLFLWEEAIKDLGMNCLSFPMKKKPYCNLIASRFALKRNNSEWNSGAPYPNLLSRAKVEVEGGAIDLFNAHIPNGSNHGMEKIDTIDTLVKELQLPKRLPQIVMGDFNEPKSEMENGEIKSWARRKSSKFSYSEAEAARWSEVVLSFFEGRTTDMRDAFREIHGFKRQITSVKINNRREPTRYDHCFVSKHFNVSSCDYDISVLESGLSDHAPLIAKVDCKK